MIIRQVQCARQVPKCPIFSLTRGFPTYSYLLLSLQSTLSHSVCDSFTCTLSSIHSGCNELSTLPEEAVTEVFIKHCNSQGAKDR